MLLVPSPSIRLRVSTFGRNAELLQTIWGRGQGEGAFVASCLGSLVMLSGMLAVLRDQSFRIWAGAALVFCLPLRWAARFLGNQSPVLILFSHATVLIYFMILAAVVLVRVIGRPGSSRRTTAPGGLRRETCGGNGQT